MATVGPAFGERKFKQNYMIRLLLAVFLLGPAGVLAWLAVHGADARERTIELAIASGLVVFFTTLCLLIARTEVTINEIGLRRESVLGTTEVPWNQVQETRYKIVPLKARTFELISDLVVEAFAKFTPANLTLRVVRRDGRQIKITSNLKNARELIALVFARINPPMVAEAGGRIARGETVTFGPLALSRNEIAWRNITRIPLSTLKSAKIEGGRLCLQQMGRRRNTVCVSSGKIPNVLVFLEVLARGLLAS